MKIIVLLMVFLASQITPVTLHSNELSVHKKPPRLLQNFQRQKNFEILYDLEPEVQNDQKDKLERLLQSAYLSQLSKMSDKDIIDEYPEAQIFYTKKTGMKLFILTDDESKVQYISIRGTSNLKNFIVDAKFWKTEDPVLGIKMHKGFLEAAQETYYLMGRALKKDYELRFQGHSLGGAIAAILGLWMDKAGAKDVKISTFGQPRFTNKEGAKLVNTAIFDRVTMDVDLVPHLPPRLLAYRHMGAEIHLEDVELPEGLQYKVRTIITEEDEMQLWDDFQNDELSPEELEGIKFRHSMKYYIAGIQGMIQHIQ